MAYFRKKRRAAKYRVFIFCLLGFGAFLALYIFFNIQLVPVLKTSAVYNAKTIAISTVNNAVGKVLKTDNVSYDKLISLQKNQSGAITAIEADSMQINLLKYDIIKEVTSELDNIKTDSLGIPVGTVIGGQLFTGRGPSIAVKIKPVGFVDAKIANEFTSAGINQTRQQIMLNIDADITVIISGYNVSTQVQTNYVVAESVIVGSVPDSYTVVDGSSDTSNRIFTYGRNGSGSSASSAASSGPIH